MRATWPVENNRACRVINCGRSSDRKGCILYIGYVSEEQTTANKRINLSPVSGGLLVVCALLRVACFTNPKVGQTCMHLSRPFLFRELAR